jgi:excinuclease ABC subunit A
VLYGSGEDEVKFTYDDGTRTFETRKPFEGVVNNLERRYRETDSDWAREDIERFFSTVPCKACHGNRLKPEALAVKVHKKHISEVTELSVRAAQEWFEALPGKLNKKQNDIAVRVLKEIRDRLRFLVDVGLDYLTLARAPARCPAARPAHPAGHPDRQPADGRDVRARRALHRPAPARQRAAHRDPPHLRDLGNTVIVVEHDEDTILRPTTSSTWGPGAGVHGGEIVAQGTPKDIWTRPQSLTGDYLRQREQFRAAQRRKGNGAAPQSRGARGNNLKNIRLEIPLGTFTCVTGVSGSGKSTLLNETLYKVLSRELNGARMPAAHGKVIEGLEHLDKVIDIDQSRSAARRARTRRPIPACSRRSATCSRPAGSKVRGYAPGRFSVQRQGRPLRGLLRATASSRSRCTSCRMSTCPARSARASATTARRSRCSYKGKQHRRGAGHDGGGGADLFSRPSRASRRKLETLMEVGARLHPPRPAGHHAVRRRSPAREAEPRNCRSAPRAAPSISWTSRPRACISPTSPAALKCCTSWWRRATRSVVIEHNLDVIKTADWIIDLGPEGGDGGGEIVATGTPEDRSASACP